MSTLHSVGRFLQKAILAFALLVAASRMQAQVADDPVTVPVGFQGIFNGQAGGQQTQATVSISPNGTDFATGSAWGGSGILTSNGTTRMRPGRTYLFTINDNRLSRLQVKITAPSGYRVFINEVEHEIFDWQTGSMLNSVGSFSVRIDDGAGSSVGEAASLRPGRVLWSVGLGSLHNGKPAGSIIMAENGLTANTYKPAALYFDRDGTSTNGAYLGTDREVIVVKYNNNLRQVYANAALADIVEESDHSYFIRFYPRGSGQIGAQDSNGIYAVSGTPIYEYHIENPTYPATDALRVTKTTNQNGTLVTWTEMAKQGGQPTGQTQWLVHDWTDKPGGATSVSSIVQHRWTYTDSDRNELLEILDGNGTLAHKVFKRYEDLNFGSETSRELSTETLGDGTSAITTTYTYYQSTANPGSWHRIRSVSVSDGSWTAFDYYDDFQRRGQVQHVRRPHKNSPASDPGTGANSGSETTFLFDFTDAFGTNKLPTSIETKIDGYVAARS